MYHELDGNKHFFVLWIFVETLYSVSTGRDGHEESVSDVACSVDGSLIATSSLDGTMKLISVSSGKVR